MNQAFYLKYRPQTFSDLDSVLAREQLVEIFSSGKIPHALLFSGSKGIGKTSAARIVAKTVNCESQSNKASELQRKKNETMKPGDKVADETLQLSYEPCNKCDSCISITNGSNVDVLEIDAASFTGVDDIRELRDKIKFSPAKLKYKVYIIDEVHRLSPQAFDALLKTLEEPPKHAIFILCTTDPEKLPKTILSRCQQINFKRATVREITEKLEKICLTEKIEFEKTALDKIAKFSEGSFRDATKILEQVSFSGKITEENVERTVGLSGQLQLKVFLETLKNRQTEKSLILISRFTEEGINLRLLIENILDQLRLCLLSNFDTGVGNCEVDFSIEECQVLIGIFTQAYIELKNAFIPQLPLEMAVVGWGETQCKVQNEKLKVDEEANRSESKKCEMGREVRVRSEEENKSDSLPTSQSIPTSHISTPPQSDFSLEDVNAKWPLILEAVKPLNHSVLAFLKACRPKNCNEGYLTLEVFYKFHKDQLEAEKCRRIFEQAASGVLNCPVKLKCELSQGRPDKLPPVPLPPVAPAFAKSDLAKARQSKKGEEDDILKVAEEIFK